MIQAFVEDGDISYSPHIPLVVDYVQEDPDSEFAAEDEVFTLALEHSNRVRRIFLRLPVLKLQTQRGISNAGIIEYTTTDKQRPVYCMSNTSGNISGTKTTSRHVEGFSISRITITFDCRASLPRHTVFEDFPVHILFPVPNYVIERQLLDMLITTRVTLPNLYQFRFGGVNAYLEVSSVAQLFNALSPAFSMVEHLTLEDKDRRLPLD